MDFKIPLEAEDCSHRTWGPFLEGTEKFSHPESYRKISNLLITELFYFHILNLNRDSLHTSSFRHIRLAVFGYRLSKYGFTGPKSFRGFRETGPWAGLCQRGLKQKSQRLWGFEDLLKNEQHVSFCFPLHAGAWDRSAPWNICSLA